MELRNLALLSCDYIDMNESLVLAKNITVFLGRTNPSPKDDV